MGTKVRNNDFTPPRGERWKCSRVRKRKVPCDTTSVSNRREAGDFAVCARPASIQSPRAGGPMKITVLLFAMFMFASLAGVSTRGQEGTLDYFLPPSCGGSPGPEPRPLAVTTETLRHHRISGAVPAYPEAAKLAGIQGAVSLYVKVDEQGNVSGVESWAGNKPVLARAAVRAVKRWKYRPVLIEDEPFAFSGEVVFTFRLG